MQIFSQDQSNDHAKAMPDSDRSTCMDLQDGIRSMPAVPPDPSASSALVAGAASGLGVGEVMQAEPWDSAVACAEWQGLACASHLPAACMAPVLALEQLSPAFCVSLAGSCLENMRQADIWEVVWSSEGFPKLANTGQTSALPQRR